MHVEEIIGSKSNFSCLKVGMLKCMLNVEVCGNVVRQMRVRRHAIFPALVQERQY